MGNFVDRLKNMLDAIAYAEAGDLDAVKEILLRKSANDSHADQNQGEMSSRSALPAL